jgi:lipopolysaccharide/colanic/teichoic acid biosynthesis glycosyltransferase
MPIVLLASVAVALGDRGNVLHKRLVIGLNGRQFHAYKLRTMRLDADAWLLEHPDLLAKYQTQVKLAQDPRVTGVGRILRALSIDELPQLLNVLCGEMSLVGPRMIHPDELPRYGDIAAQRLSIRPGITGLWQVSGRQDLSYETRIRLDAEYLANRSVWLDLKILFRTLPAVLKRQGAV